MCYFPSTVGQIGLSERSYSWLQGDKTAKLALFRDNCSEKQFKRTAVKKDYINEGTSPDLDRVNYARPLKVTKAE
jgi:hypothetical protein